MGVVGRVTERVGDALLEAFGDGVFEPLGLVMHFVPRVPQCLLEIGFQEAVVADHLQCHPATGAGESHAPIALMLYQSQGGEPLDHPGDRCGPHPETRREVAGSHRPRGLPPEQQDLLEVVLLGLGQRRADFVRHSQSEHKLLVVPKSVSSGPLGRRARDHRFWKRHPCRPPTDRPRPRGRRPLGCANMTVRRMRCVTTNS